MSKVVGTTSARDGALGLADRLVKGRVEAANPGRVVALFEGAFVVVVAWKRENAVQALSVVLGTTTSRGACSWPLSASTRGESGVGDYSQ